MCSWSRKGNILQLNQMWAVSMSYQCLVSRNRVRRDKNWELRIQRLWVQAGFKVNFNQNHIIFKGMCGGPRCTILMHVNAYELWCCGRVIPLNPYIFTRIWSKITKIFKGTTWSQDTMLWTPTHHLKSSYEASECTGPRMFGGSKSKNMDFLY